MPIQFLPPWAVVGPSTDPVVDYVRGYCTVNHVKLVGLYDF